MGRRRESATEVPVRALKNRLSEYLRRVEAGTTVVVTSHGRALADLVPHRDEASGPARLSVRRPSRAWGSVALPAERSRRGDTVALLLHERRRR